MQSTTKQQAASPPSKPQEVDPPEIQTLRSILDEESRLAGKIAECEELAARAQGKIESSIFEVDLNDLDAIARVATLRDQVEFARRRVEKFSYDREDVQQRLNEQYEPARRVVGQALRTITNTLIDKEIEILKPRFSKEEQRRQIAAKAEAPFEARQRESQFGLASKIPLDRLRVDPALGREVITWWTAAKSKLDELGAEFGGA